MTDKEFRRLSKTQLIEIIFRLKGEGQAASEEGDLPSMEQIVAERERRQQGKLFGKTLRSTIAILVVVAAVAVLVSTLWMPVLQIYGSSMAPLLEDGEIVVLTKSHTYDTGEVMAFYYNNKILVKRVIGKSGDWIRMEEDGTVFVNDVELDEPYLNEKHLGECDLEFPYQVPEKAYFVLGDHRSVSIDSRSSLVGCVREEQIVGKLALRVWPLKQISSFF
ncbi:MAG: signal peptidase I [Faecalimonas sp.]|nr:signal peptidase I [Faecalimonas sp.]